MLFVNNIILSAMLIAHCSVGHPILNPVLTKVFAEHHCLSKNCPSLSPEPMVAAQLVILRLKALDDPHLDIEYSTFSNWGRVSGQGLQNSYLKGQKRGFQVTSHGDLQSLQFCAKTVPNGESRNWTGLRSQIWKIRYMQVVGMYVCTSYLRCYETLKAWSHWDNYCGFKVGNPSLLWPDLVTWLLVAWGRKFHTMCLVQLLAAKTTARNAAIFRYPLKTSN